MKKFVLFTMLGLSAFSLAKAQEYNLFDAKDVDANGWIWFDSQEKIDKYVGEGKLIELFDAMHGGEGATTEASPSLIGAGTDAIIGGDAHKVGGISLANTLLNGQASGGRFEIKLPSCITFDVFLSIGGSFRLSAEASNDGFDWIKLKSIYTTFPIPKIKGQLEWALHTFELTSGFSLKSEKEIYAAIQNYSAIPLMVHGMRIMTSTPTSGISENIIDGKYNFNGQELTLDQNANIEVYSLTGAKLANVNASAYSFSAYNKGVYILKVDGKGSKIVVR